MLEREKVKRLNEGDVSAATGAAAARRVRISFGKWKADLLGEAVGMFHPESNDQFIEIANDADNGELRNQAIFILQLHLEIVISQNRSGTDDDIDQLAGWKPVISVVSHPGLKAKVGDFPDRRSTVQKGLVDPAHLGDVGVKRNHAAIRQDELEVVIGMFRQEVFEFGCFHGCIGLLEGLGKGL